MRSRVNRLLVVVAELQSASMHEHAPSDQTMADLKHLIESVGGVPSDSLTPASTTPMSKIDELPVAHASDSSGAHSSNQEIIAHAKRR